mmetsp:Transcript_56381/g.160052  ORF Transcript_56381/g.160052 Transcript_56381/m.160052 type:complete len:80 (+) Transcript_56381:85-324(+)
MCLFHSVNIYIYIYISLGSGFFLEKLSVQIGQGSKIKHGCQMQMISAVVSMSSRKGQPLSQIKWEPKIFPIFCMDECLL